MNDSQIINWTAVLAISTVMTLCEAYILVKYDMSVGDVILDVIRLTVFLFLAILGLVGLWRELKQTPSSHSPQSPQLHTLAQYTFLLSN